MNTHYETDTETEVVSMKEYFSGMSEINWIDAEKDYFELFSSYFTFHLKIVKEIITEAREILNPENRDHVKNLVGYVREAEEWFSALKEQRKSSVTTAS